MHVDPPPGEQPALGVAAYPYPSPAPSSTPRSRVGPPLRLRVVTLTTVIILVLLVFGGTKQLVIGRRAQPAPGGAKEASEPALEVREVSKTSNRKPVRVYIYDHPATDSSDLIRCYRDSHDGIAPWQDERADMAQDMGEVWLHRALLEHPWRVLDPEDADLFFVPIYPILGYKLLDMDKGTCAGRTHRHHVDDALLSLERNSIYFKRFGGADHVVVCAWWNCHTALTPWHRMLLRRAVVGINEFVATWANWGCADRMVVVPYTASSVVSTSEEFGGLSAEERDIPFYFVGSQRNRLERQNLNVVQKLSPQSVIELGDDPHTWGMNATVNAHHLSRSRFCFCPRGDTFTSRRIFDAIAAGCIPIITAQEAAVLPFHKAEMNSSEFAVVAPTDTFGSRAKISKLVKDLLSRSDAELVPLRGGVRRCARSMLYGVADGPEIDDMHFFMDTASNFLEEAQAQAIGPNRTWSCLRKGWSETRVAPRTKAAMPPSDDMRRQWLFESETIVNVEHSLLFCAPPNTGSMQFRMLAKRMQGVDHWAVSSHRSMLFDPVASELPLLDIDDAELMNAVYQENTSGWIKIGVVRDPVTRLLSAYLDLVQAARSESLPNSIASNHDRRRLGLLDGERHWLNAIGWGRRRELGEEGRAPEGVHEEEGNARDLLDGQQPKVVEARFVTEGIVVAPVMPTFEELLEALGNSMPNAPPAFRPMTSLCGMRHSPFDTVIPFETLQKTSTEVLKSLPNDIWNTYGASGWGPRGEHAFMEFDYRAGLLEGDEGRESTVKDGAGSNEKDAAPRAAPRRARDLFDNGSCAWTAYFPDEETLNKVRSLYASDYDHFHWYGVDYWKQRLKEC